MLKRIAAVLLAAIICIAAVGCSSSEGAPDGMQLVSLEGEPFKLYVPDSWTDNSASGISGACYSSLYNAAVSARYRTPDAEHTTLDEYVLYCAQTYVDTMLAELLSNRASVLGGRDARELTYTAKHESVEYTFRQLITEYDGVFVILSFSCPSEYYESLESDFDSVVEEFVLCERSEPEGDCVTDKKTPEGMKIASADMLEYRLYVPQAWICDSESERSEAYYPESGGPNVTVTSYSPDETVTAEEYFETCDKEYKSAINGYELLSREDGTVAERDAVSFVYRAEYGDMRLKLMQTVLVYNDMVYSIVYTALEDSFDAHMDDVNAIIDAFIFR